MIEIKKLFFNVWKSNIDQCRTSTAGNVQVLAIIFNSARDDYYRELLII
jgi:hypothetical protein